MRRRRHLRILGWYSRRMLGIVRSSDKRLSFVVYDCEAATAAGAFCLVRASVEWFSVSASSDCLQRASSEWSSVDRSARSSFFVSVDSRVRAKRPAGETARSADETARSADETARSADETARSADE